MGLVPLAELTVVELAARQGSGNGVLSDESQGLHLGSDVLLHYGVLLSKQKVLWTFQSLIAQAVKPWCVP